MSIANPRWQAIQTVQNRRAVKGQIEYAQTPLGEVFGANVFSRTVMRTLVPKNAYVALTRCLDRGEQLDRSLADTVANAMKDWAISRGATHFTHWFQPMTELTAEKHDAFLSKTVEDEWILEFSGRNLIQGEPDASSFPSGGIRSTFEARGYTGWDPTSPAFLMESTNGKTLCIPTIFCSFSGHALDKKTPLLRSLDALNKQAVRLLRVLGSTEVKYVTCTVGPEQEYFLIDEAFYALRPDLINAGRCLFGARPPKGQEMEDHYWGSIKERVLAFMMDAEAELYKLGVPVKTRHNEVAPGQFEVAPVFETSNVATDHNMLLMEVFRRTAQKHGLRCLFHEKPFSGINGSGKHNNWSISDDQGNNLLEPGHTPHENEQFLVILTAIIRAMNKWAKLLRASIAFAGNDHRLGANEAPPAIMSVFLGDTLTEVVEGIISGKPGKGNRAGAVIQLGVSVMPELPRDTSDRNRTSPFAFTGNKFEFRAVGASQSIAFPNTVLNTMVAESLDYMATRIEEARRGGKNPDEAVQAVVKDVLSENQRVIFNGDNYSEEWHKEAERRGLPNLRNTVEALPALVEAEAKELFSKYGVLNEEELVSRYNVMLESYCKTINIEAQLTVNMARTMILPAVLEYQRRVGEAIVVMHQALRQEERPNTSVHDALLKDLFEKTSKLKFAIDQLDAIMKDGEHESGDLLGHARFYREKVIPAMDAVRAIADDLELVVDDALWPLPKFREMLYML
ncbi:MAG TPA: glutamine synthetase III [Candidatus Obscuribacterales bacterium]